MAVGALAQVVGVAVAVKDLRQESVFYFVEGASTARCHLGELGQSGNVYSPGFVVGKVELQAVDFVLCQDVDEGLEVVKTVELACGSKILQTWIYVAPSKEGHTFSGWSEIPETMPAHDVTISGSYTINKYKLIYQVDDETYKSVEIEYGSAITPEKDPSKEGYTFSGWSEIPETMPAYDIKVEGHFILLGDANGDGVVNVADIVEIINFMNMNVSESFNIKAADVIEDDNIDNNDIIAINAIIMSSH